MDESWLGQALRRVIASKNGALPLFECKRKKVEYVEECMQRQGHKAFCHASEASPMAQEWALSFFVVMDSANCGSMERRTSA